MRAERVGVQAARGTFQSTAQCHKFPAGGAAGSTCEVIAPPQDARYVRGVSVDAALPHPGATRAPIGELLRAWRRRRSLSQLELALEADVSSRHVSFLETGRARPSREMVLRLAEHLEIPLRERNSLLLAAGFAPLYAERSLEEPEMAPVQQALDRFLRAHEPYPAVILDRHYNLISANDAASVLTEGVEPELLEPPANALRVTLHPRGMAPRILNMTEWSAHLLHRLRRQASITGDPELEELYAELSGYPGISVEAPPERARRQRDRAPAANARRRPRAGVLQHRLDVRHRGRDHESPSS